MVFVVGVVVFIIVLVEMVLRNLIVILAATALDAVVCIISPLHVAPYRCCHYGGC